jgi:hypothetical protein
MASLELNGFSYFPSIRTRLWEMRGYRELTDEDKKKFVPIITLSKHSQRTETKSVTETILEEFKDRPYILDLEINSVYACIDSSALCDPENGFAKWREFSKSHPGAAPVALITPDASIRDTVRQAIEIEKTHGQVILRSRSPMTDLPVLTAILSAVDSIANLHVILDFGYIRGQIKAIQAEATTVINSLLEIDLGLHLIVVSSSYPRAVAAYDDAGTTLEIEERILHEAIGGDTIATYGDYASIHSEPFAPSPSRFVPRVDYALPDAWIFRRVREDKGGFKKCAEQILDLNEWEPELVNDVWGAKMIAEAAAGDLTRKNTPGFWIAARMNLHIWRQLNYTLPPDDTDEG